MNTEMRIVMKRDNSMPAFLTNRTIAPVSRVSTVNMMNADLFIVEFITNVLDILNMVVQIG